MTDAGLIAELRRNADAHFQGIPLARRVTGEQLSKAADRLTQLSEDNERLRKALHPFGEVTILPTGDVVGLERFWFDRARATLAQGQKEGA